MRKIIALALLYFAWRRSRQGTSAPTAPPPPQLPAPPKQLPAGRQPD